MREVKVSFRIMARDLDPYWITSLLEVKPSIFHSRGDPSFGKNGRVYADFQAGLWSIESQLDKSEDLEDHVLNLLDRLESKASVLRQLSDEGYEIDCFIGVFTNCSPVGFCVTYKLIKRLAQFPVDLNFDIYINESKN